MTHTTWEYSAEKGLTGVDIVFTEGAGIREVLHECAHVIYRSRWGPDAETHGPIFSVIETALHAAVNYRGEEKATDRILQTRLSAAEERLVKYKTEMRGQDKYHDEAKFLRTKLSRAEKVVAAAKKEQASWDEDLRDPELLVAIRRFDEDA